MVVLQLKTISPTSFLFCFCKFNDFNLNKKINFRQLVRYKSTMENKKRIAVCQMTATGDREKNMNAVSNLIEKASKKNVQVIN